MSTTAIASAGTEAKVNREHLAELRSICAVTPVNPLVLDVEAKVEAGETLNSVEYGVLWHAITNEMLNFVREHPELLG